MREVELLRSQCEQLRTEADAMRARLQFAGPGDCKPPLARAGVLTDSPLNPLEGVQVSASALACTQPFILLAANARGWADASTVRAGGGGSGEGGCPKAP